MSSKRMIPAPPTKFRFDERFVCSMGEHTGWASWDGRRGIVIGPPEYRDQWDCGSVDGSRESGHGAAGWRYPVLVEGRPHLQHFCEEHMRKLRGDLHVRKLRVRKPRASTWDEFEKATGLRLDRQPVAAVTTARKSPKRRGRQSEGRHG